MLNYIKNFLVKLLLVPIFALLGCIFLLIFLLHPQFRLFKNNRPWTFTKTRGKVYGEQKAKDKDYEAFY